MRGLGSLEGALWEGKPSPPLAPLHPKGEGDCLGEREVLRDPCENPSLAPEPSLRGGEGLRPPEPTR